MSDKIRRPENSDVVTSASDQTSLTVVDGNQSQKTGTGCSIVAMEWQRTVTAPFDRDLQLAVIDASGVHTLIFPCRRILRGWIKAETHEPVKVYPTHWREWNDAVSPLFSRTASRAAS